ncbi:MAG: tryptophan synthase subunit alpha [Bacteroidota bacterium]
MKNRIEKLFQRKSRNILSVYFTAGYPELNDTVNIIRYLDEAGADMIEIGIPFSDPVADGPVIQNSSRIAIRKGMTLDLLFSQLEYIRRYTGIPLLLMGYMNPVLQFGEEKFIKTCIDTGIDGVIIPDMPPEYFAGKLRSKYRSAGLFNILLISSDTTNERIHMIDKLSNGFIYMVSPGATTGGLLRPEPAKA